MCIAKVRDRKSPSLLPLLFYFSTLRKELIVGSGSWMRGRRNRAFSFQHAVLLTPDASVHIPLLTHPSYLHASCLHGDSIVSRLVSHCYSDSYLHASCITGTL